MNINGYMQLYVCRMFKDKVQIQNLAQLSCKTTVALVQLVLMNVLILAPDWVT